MNAEHKSEDQGDVRWRVFHLNDCEWWVARTLDEAKTDYMAYNTGVSEEEAFDEPYELTEEQMGRLKYIDDPELPRAEWVRRTFRAELKRRVEAGLSKPELFACTEY